MQRIGFMPRLGAALIDIVILLVLATVVGWFTGGFFSATPKGSMNPITGSIVVWLFGLAYGLIEGLTGASPGKRILKIIIRNQDGSPATTNTLLKRFIIKNASTALNVLGYITTLGLFLTLGFLAGLAIFVGCFLVLRPNRLALHDMLAKTAVYPAQAAFVEQYSQAAPPPPPPPPPPPAR